VRSVGAWLMQEAIPHTLTLAVTTEFVVWLLYKLAESPSMPFSRRFILS
jgi:hypothetical protein